MKYRRLTEAQLKSLENEFVQFLVINGILADDWSKMKSEQPDHAEKMINLFSDVVFEGILRKTDYIEWSSPHEIRAFQCLKDKFVLVGLKADEKVEIDLQDHNWIGEAMNNPPEGISVYTTDKVYLKEREQEIFEMLESGCYITDGKMFKVIATGLI